MRRARKEEAQGRSSSWESPNRSGQIDPEFRAAIGTVLQHERRAMVGEDLLHDGEAEPAAVALGGEEGREKLALARFVDAASAVAYDEQAVAPDDVDRAVRADRLH